MLSANIGFTYKCNLNCKHCYSNIERNSICKIEKDLNWWKSIIDILYNEGCMSIAFGYGESILRNDFFNLASYVNEKNIYQCLLSNGYFIDQYINDIKYSGINKVLVSLDSMNKYIHDNNRNKIGCFEKALKNLDLMIKNNIICGIAFTYSSNNFLDIPSLCEYAENHGIKFISIMRQRNCDVNYSNSLQNEITTIINSMELFKDKITFYIHDNNLNNAISKSSFSNYFKELYFVSNCCRKYMNDSISISPDGGIKSCVFDNSYICKISNPDELKEFLTRKIIFTNNIGESQPCSHLISNREK